MVSRNTWVGADSKRPIQPNGRAASSTDCKTWHSFSDVQKGAGDGYGIMLGDGLGCIDLDHCLDGDKLEDWAAQILATEAPIYVERSVSGTGLHIFIETPETAGSKNGNIERYSRARFIRTTGDTYNTPHT